MSNGMDEFKKMVLDFTDIGAIGMKLAVAAPFIGLSVQLGPPPAATVSVLTALCELLVLIWAFHFWDGLSEAAQNLRMKIALICFCIGLIASLVLISTYTVSPNADGQKIVKGFVVLPTVKPLIGRELSSADDALKSAQYDATEVWTATSVTAVHVTLIVVWLTTFASLAAFIALFILGRRQVADKPAS